MGTDIHLFIEYTDKEEGSEGCWDSWSDDGELSVGRCYRLFRLLAGVRGEEKDAVYPIQGYPKDASWSIKEEHSNEDCHTASWLSLGEFKDVLSRYGSKELPWGWQAVLTAAEALSREHKGLRLVFCFDN